MSCDATYASLTAKNWTGTHIFATMIDSIHTNTSMKKIHSILVTAYLIGGLALMATTPFADLRGQVQTYNGGATLSVKGLHGSADESVRLADEALDTAKSAAASRHLMLGILLFTFGGMVHAYQTAREERPVHITVKKRKPILMYWLEMKL